MTVIHKKQTKAVESGVKFHCDVCSCDCTNLVRIKCAECPDYDLCVPCFAAGKATANHKPYHAYSVIEQHAYPIFTETWGADEELLLIEGSEACGLGNWQEVAEHIGGRLRDEVCQHYINVYINSDSYPIPNMKRKFSITPEEFAARKKTRLEERSRALVDLPLPKHKSTASHPACHEVQGYMPGRLEFEQEAENDAEMVVKDMVFDPEDTEGEIELKLTVLDIYNSRLTTRAEQKRLLFAHHLMDYRKNMAIDRKRTKEERDLFNKLKPFARILNPNEFEMFSDDMLRELQIRRRIAELQEYRQNGVRTFAVSQQYEKDKASRTALIRSNIPPAGRYGHHLGTPGSRGRPPLSSLDGTSSKLVRKIPANPLDISHAADVEFLSPAEHALCSQLRIMPKPYIAIKETLFRELLRTGGVLKRRTARELIKIDVNKTTKIYDFFLDQKWLS